MRAAAAMVCVMVAIASGASAQGLGYGVKAGANLSTFQATDDGDSTSFNMLTGLVAGGFLTWSLGGRLEVQPEVLFSQKGASFDEAGVDLKERIEYLDVPVLASYRIFGAAERHVSVFGGPSFGVRLRAKVRSSFGGDTLETDVSDQVTRTDLGLVAGAAYHRGRLVLDGRYAFGITDIDDETDDAIKVKNRGISITAGWRF